MNNKHLQIFIASSSELSPERDATALLLFDLSEHGRGAEGTPIFPKRWEEMDATVSYCRPKNEDYKDEVRQSAFFIALFWKTCGQYTLDELACALQQQAEGEQPRDILLLIKRTGGEHAESEAAMEQQLRAHLGERGEKLHLRYFVDTHELRFELLCEMLPYLRQHHGYPTPRIQCREDELCVHDEIRIRTGAWRSGASAECLAAELEKHSTIS